MPKRNIGPETGQPAFSYRENRMVDRFAANGGNRLGERQAYPDG